MDPDLTAWFDPRVYRPFHKGTPSMLSVYLGCLAFGGIFIGASMFGGHDHHGDAGGHDGGHGDDGDHHGHHGPWLPLLSVRFWTFSLAFFGLTGAVLTAAGALTTALIPAVAGVLGLGSGYGASRVLGALANRPVGLLAASPVGKEGRVLLPIAVGQRGKIRVTSGGNSSDFVAETDANQTLPVGAAALIVAMRGNVAVVERSPADGLALPAASNKENT